MPSVLTALRKGMMVGFRILLVQGKELILIKFILCHAIHSENSGYCNWNKPIVQNFFDRLFTQMNSEMTGLVS